MQDRPLGCPGGPVAWGVAALCAAWSATASGHGPPPRPTDPDASTPHMVAPGGQPPDDRRRRAANWASNASSRRRVTLWLSPLFASYRLAFIGRPNQPIRGGGIGADVDVEIFSPIGLRLTASYSGHRLADQFMRPDDGAPTLAARGGTLHTVDFGAAVLFALDIGRVRPGLEAGIGGTLVRTPRAAVDGQRDGACLAGGGCDIGLMCATQENVCRQSVVPRIHGGAAIEVMLGDRWSVAATVRYFALVSAPSVFPVYLQAGLRAGVRF